LLQHDDIRGRLREDHDAYLAELEALRLEADAQRCLARLRALRHAWAIHSLAEESVVYRAVESADPIALPAVDIDARFIEHELIEGLFEKLERGRPGTMDWRARLKVARELIARHIEHEHAKLFMRLERQLDAGALRRMAGDFERERERLAGLEEAKAA
jgi:hemerythrin-like domain-containing protein